MTRRNRRGFTLVELLAALAVLGLALAGGALLLDQLTDASGRIAHDRLVIARDNNGARLLRQLLRDAHLDGDTASRFRGDPRSADFTTMCPSPLGWLERCRATIAVDQRTDSAAIIAELPGAAPLTLATHPGTAELRYFDAGVADSAWTRRWALSITMPTAIGVVLGSDTLVYPLGAARD